MFLRSGYRFCDQYERRGTMIISGREFFPVQICFKRVLARSRFRHFGFVLVAEAKAKTVTSLLPQPSVLWAVIVNSNPKSQYSESLLS